MNTTHLVYLPLVPLTFFLSYYGMGRLFGFIEDKCSDLLSVALITTIIFFVGVPILLALVVALIWIFGGLQ